MGIPELSRTPERTSGARNLIFRAEAFSAAYPEAIELTRLHWEEITQFKELFTLNPDLEVYKNLQAKNALHLITARDDGFLVGYFVFIIYPHLHYKHVLVANEDIHFLHPDYRKGTAGLRLIKAAESRMRELGAKVSLVRTKVSQSHAVIFERLGYTAMDLTYGKRL